MGLIKSYFQLPKIEIDPGDEAAQIKIEKPAPRASEATLQTIGDHATIAAQRAQSLGPLD
jgi:hypothetical protein